MENVQQRRAIANVIASATLLIAIFAGLTNNLTVAAALAVISLTISVVVARLPTPWLDRARRPGQSA